MRYTYISIYNKRWIYGDAQHIRIMRSTTSALWDGQRIGPHRSHHKRGTNYDRVSDPLTSRTQPGIQSIQEKLYSSGAMDTLIPYTHPQPNQITRDSQIHYCRSTLIQKKNQSATGYLVDKSSHYWPSNCTNWNRPGHIDPLKKVHSAPFTTVHYHKPANLIRWHVTIPPSHCGTQF